MARKSKAVAGAIAVGLMLVGCGPRFNPNAFLGNAPPAQTGSQPTTAPTTAAPTQTANGERRTETRRGVIKGSGKGNVVKGGVIKVGGLFPLTGGLSAMGRPAWQGAEAYFNWVNAHGGVNGKKFEFVECDDQASDTLSTTCAKKLVEQDGIFVMGPSFTPFSLTVINQLEDAAVPWIGYDGINVEGFGKPNVVTVGAPIDTMAHALLPHWYRKVQRDTGSPPKRIGAVTLDVPPAITYVNEAKNVICPKLGCEIVRDQRVNYTTTDYATICNTMKNARVDAVWIITDAASAVKLLVQCRDIAQWKPPKGYLGQHGLYLDLTLRQVGPYASGIVANGAVVPESIDSAATSEMKNIISTYFGPSDYGYWAALAFSSARMVVDLVKSVLDAGKELNRANMLAAAKTYTRYECSGMCRNVNLTPPAQMTGGNHNVWLVRADFGAGHPKGRWLPEAGPIDGFTVDTWPCRGRPRPC